MVRSRLKNRFNETTFDNTGHSIKNIGTFVRIQRSTLGPWQFLTAYSPLMMENTFLLFLFLNIFTFSS